MPAYNSRRPLQVQKQLQKHMSRLGQAPELGVALVVLLAFSLFLSAREKLRQS